METLILADGYQLFPLACRSEHASLDPCHPVMIEQAKGWSNNRVALRYVRTVSNVQPKVKVTF